MYRLIYTGGTPVFCVHCFQLATPPGFQVNRIPKGNPVCSIYVYVYKALRVAGGTDRYARSQGRMERDDICGRWSNISGANRRLANAKSSMLQENNPDAACMYVV